MFPDDEILTEWKHTALCIPVLCCISANKLSLFEIIQKHILNQQRIITNSSDLKMPYTTIIVSFVVKEFNLAVKTKRCKRG